MKDGRIRIVYHPAPGPSGDGEIRRPTPIVLGRDLGFALAWIRRRLALGAPSHGERKDPVYLPPEQR